MFLQARTDELRIQKRFLNDMFARVKQEYLERRLRQQQIEQMLGHKGNLAALPSTSAQEAGPSNALALRPADSSALADQADASPGQGSFSYAFCTHWEFPVCSVFTGRFRRYAVSHGHVSGDVHSQCLRCNVPGRKRMCSLPLGLCSSHHQMYVWHNICT